MLMSAPPHTLQKTSQGLFFFLFFSRRLSRYVHNACIEFHGEQCTDTKPPKVLSFVTLSLSNSYSGFEVIECGRQDR